MTHILRMILRHLTKAGTDRPTNGSQRLSAEQKAAHKRVQKAIRATERMNRV